MYWEVVRNGPTSGDSRSIGQGHGGLAYDLAVAYASKSQIARVLSEAWVAEHGYCLACDSDRLKPTKPNTQVRDFECNACGHPYELKSSTAAVGRKVVDGAYSAMMRRVESGTLPTFLLLRYTAEAIVTDLSAIHRVLITPDLIERRKPLSLSAKRAGWVGCNLLFGGMPPEGRIVLMRAQVLQNKSLCRLSFRATARLADKSARSRDWSRALLSCLHQLPVGIFSLKQVYYFEHQLAVQFPKNRHIREKIRQQLQVLRDAGLLHFEERGRYYLPGTAADQG